MTIFERLWTSFKSIFSHFWGDNGKAIEDWGAQFLSDMGQIILADTATYGVQIFTGQITIVEAAEKVWIDLRNKAVTEGKQEIETVFNALRTHTNSAAKAAGQVAP